MEARILGIQVVDFINKEGEHIAGTKLHYASKEDNVNGMGVDTVFVHKNGNIELPDGIAPNVSALIHFNKKGKLTGLQVIKPAK